ncbi:MAG: LysM peptidoglycan-binding domain-containing protein [Thermoflexales bacterium]|nr:LysM peptidoglycan-binding domain-containing protein [Thermoflexales bacterium]
MRKYAHWVTIWIVLLVTLAPSWVAHAAPVAQGSVTLSNAGFEAGTTNGWNFWSKPEEIVKVGKDIDMNNSWYTPMFVPNQIGNRVHSGGQALEINNEYRKWRGGVYQTVSATPGTKVIFKIWAQGYTTTGQKMIVRVGIDPNGGSSVDAATWGGTAWPGESYLQVSTPEVTVGGGGRVTVFTLAETPSPDQKTAIFFDDASLEITGQAQAQATTPAQPAPQPTTPPVVAQPIQASQPQADGSIVYTVKSGDTLGAIAAVHNTTVDSIMQLNGLSSTIISIGQELIIRAPTTAPTATQPPAPEVPPTAEPTPVPPPSPTGEICVLAYNDRDGNGQAGGVGEDPLPGVVFALASTQGALQNYTTDGINEPHCFIDLAPDTYTVNIVPPSGYRATTLAAWTLAVAAGQQVDVQFGATRGESPPTATPPAKQAGGGGGNPLLGTVGRIILGLLATVALIGLGAAGMYYVAMRR